MPLRSLLGQGNTHLTKQAFSTLTPSQIFLVGTRELDPPEKTFIAQNRFHELSASSVNKQQNNSLLSAIQAAGCHKIYIHLDLDVVEPDSFPHVTCPTPGGIEITPLKALISKLIDSFELVGASVLEFLPTDSNLAGTPIASELIDILRL